MPPKRKSSRHAVTSPKVDRADKEVAELSEDKAVAPELSEREKKKQNFIVRTIWTVVMIAGFFLILSAGHIWVILLVALIQVLTFKEVIKLASEPAQEKSLPWGRLLNWYFLATTIYFLEGENVIYYFQHVVVVDSYLLPLAVHHRFISYCMYLFGFVFFVYSLEKGHYRFQFMQFCVTHMTLLMVVFQAHFIVKNIFNGLFWFVLPAALVISNDISAYLCGITFGRTQLIKISPKKTVEGFLGAWICTVVLGMVITHFLIKIPYLICRPSVRDLGATAWSGMTCKPDSIFVQRPYPTPAFLVAYLGENGRFMMAPIYYHVFFLATFASLIAPFGGFFASGLKRTFHVKDFGDTIPGHGGITDRMDCQFLMGFFSYLYYESFVSNHLLSAETLLHMIITNLSHDEQLQLYGEFKDYLSNRSLI